MSLNVDVRMDIKRALLDFTVIEAEHKTAAVRALNYAANGARTDAVKSLKKLYASIKLSDIRKRIKIVRASRGKLQSTVFFSGGRIPLFGNFGMRSRKQSAGVSFRNLPWRVEDQWGDEVTPEMMSRAFRNRLRRGGRATVFARYGKERMPIAVLLAPSLGKTIVDKQIVASLSVAGRNRFVKEYERQLKVVIEKRAAAAAPAAVPS